MILKPELAHFKEYKEYKTNVWISRLAYRLPRKNYRLALFKRQ